MSKWHSDVVVQRLRSYLQIQSVHPDVDYDECVVFMKHQAEEIGLDVEVIEFVPKKPIVIMTWTGSDPELPSILLNSHMDVVPVSEEHWTYPPFDALITEDGWIYARGTQDMKGLGMAHLEAVRKLKLSGVQLKRTVHLTFVPDEEIGGIDGMAHFVKSQRFAEMNVGLELDESMPNSEKDALILFYGERTCRQITVTCLGNPGHGATFSDTVTAGEKLHYMIDKLMCYRREQKILHKAGKALGDVTTINLTQIEGGVQVNVLPSSLTASFDVRLAPDVDHDEFEQQLLKWCQEAGDGVSFEYFNKNPPVKNTDLENPLVKAVIQTVNNLGISLDICVCPGTTDARYVRSRNIPALNLTPIDNTPILLHSHDERIHVESYKKCIGIVEQIVVAVANL